MKLRRLNLSRFYIRIVNIVQRFSLPLIVIILLFLISIATAKGLSVLRKYDVRPIDLLNFFGQPKEKMDTTNGITNFLFLGIRGEGSDSPNLSDTIIVFSYNHDTQTASLVSVPRDIWVPSLKAKINTAYHYGEEASAGAGIKMAQAAILEIVGLPIHYTAIVDFALFKDVINLLGGIVVQNDTAFTDTEYPLAGKENALPVSSRYETISFPAGQINLDGDTALKFVRSRHSSGDTGTDFDRGKRQQLVISSLKEKLLSPDFALNQEKMSSLFDLVNSRLKTSLQPAIFPAIAKIAVDMQGKSINSVSLSDRPDDKGITVLYNPPLYQYSGQWVLIPKQNNWSALKQYVQNRLNGTQ